VIFISLIKVYNVHVLFQKKYVEREYIKFILFASTYQSVMLITNGENLQFNHWVLPSGRRLFWWQEYKGFLCRGWL